MLMRYCTVIGADLKSYLSNLVYFGAETIKSVRVPTLRYWYLMSKALKSGHYLDHHYSKY